MKALLALLLLSSVAIADPAPAKLEIENTFGFDVMKPKTKCAKLTGALLKKLNTSYTCMAPDGSVGTASGKVQVAECKVKKGKKSELMLFATAADCNEERETQLANGA